MAEGVLFEFAGEVLRHLASLAYHELGLAWGVKAELSKLNDSVSLIKDGLRVVEEQQRNNNPAVTNWIGQFKDALYDVDDLLDDLSTEALRRRIMSGNKTMKEVRIFFSKSNQIAYSFKMGHRVKAIRERLDKIADDKAKFHFTDHPMELPAELKERGQTHSFVRAEEVIGRDDDKKKIVGLLLEPHPEDNVSIVPIIGIGGLGKTTLAKMVFNDEKVGSHFELKMWVCVSEQFEVKVIVEKIIEAATRSKPEKDLQMETLQNQLREKINGKKYLLVLDDVWNDERQRWLNLRDLLLGGARGSWIVITTRSELVAQITRTHRVSPHVLEGLSESQSWSLLKQVTFREQSQESDNSRLKEIGTEIAKQCKGVPLALREIGNVLFERTEAEWFKVKNNVLQYLTQQANSIMPILKLSYDHLPPHLRRCFAYCSLIPKDTEFEVERLIRHWMAQGFIQQPPSGDEDLEDIGQKYFMDLLWGSFFQVEEKDESGNVFFFTMHDLMHDLACSVAGTECCIASLGAEEVNERTRHVSFRNLNTSWKLPSTLLKAHRLRTFSTFGYGSLNGSTCSALMSSFKCLRMLDLSGLGIETLPSSIGELKYLRVLDLSENEIIKKLPNSLCRLQNLQTLRLIDCRNLEKLMRKIRRLVSLRYLYINDCEELAYMPRGLGKLSCLQTLDKFVVGKTGRHVGQLRELNGLNKLKGRLHISSLENAILEPRSSCLKEKLSLKSLILSWEGTHVDIGDAEIVLECLQPHPNLEELMVYDYPGRKIPSWLSSISNLTELRLKDCFECKHLPPLHQLCSLKILSLTNLKALEKVSENEKHKELSSKSTTILPSLEVLNLIDCPNLKGWWRGDVGEASNAQSPCFPRLSELDILDCLNLISMPLFPSAKDVRLEKTSWKPLQQTMRLKMTTSEAPSSSSSSPLFPPFCKLEELMLKEIEDLDSLLDEFLQNLTSLQSLCIEGCINLTSMVEKMHSLTSVTNSKSTTILPSLEALKLQDCPNLKGWWRGDVGEASNAQSPCFPCLSKLDIQRCPNLISMPLFPSVKEVYLSNTSGKPLQQTMRLKMTTSEAPSSSLSSPLIPPFCKLESLVLHKIEDLDFLPDEFLQNLTSLQSLRIEGCINLTSMVEKMHSLASLTNSKSTTILPSLEVLEVKDCPNLKGWWRGNVGEASNAQSPCFPCLSELDIRCCPNLISMPLFPSVKEVRLSYTSGKPLQQTMRLKMTTSEAPSSSSSSPLFPPCCKLKILELTQIEDLDSFPDELLQNLTSLRSLRIELCINLTSMVEKMHSLNSLTNSKSTTILPSLEVLRLLYCPNLKGWWRGDVGEASNAQSPCFPCLSELRIVCCPNLISMPLFPSVKEVYLIKTSCKPLQQTMRLKMTTSEAPSSSSSSPLFPPFCKLKSLRLDEIEDLDSLPDEYLQNLTSLQSLSIEGCINLTSMVEKMHSLTSLTNSKSTTILPSLEVLDLIDCPNLKGWWRGDVGEASNAKLPCFPRLSELDIRDCPNLISMPLFPSVKKVNLTKTSCKPLQQTMKLKMTTSEAPSSSSSSPLFPPFCKLEELWLTEIEDLDSLPDEFLQNLTSLRCLHIDGCINLPSMPDGMRHLTSLRDLYIDACPQLSERCQRDIGVDWPNIAHIESIWLDGRWVQYPQLSERCQRDIAWS